MFCVCVCLFGWLLNIISAGFPLTYIRREEERAMHADPHAVVYTLHMDFRYEYIPNDVRS